MLLCTSLKWGRQVELGPYTDLLQLADHLQQQLLLVDALPITLCQQSSHPVDQLTDNQQRMVLWVVRRGRRCLGCCHCSCDRSRACSVKL
jgi:hypothetical protein